MSYQQQRPRNGNQRPSQPPSPLAPILQEMKQRSGTGALATWLTPKDYALPTGWAQRFAEAAFNDQSVRQLRRIHQQMLHAQGLQQKRGQGALAIDVQNVLYLTLPQIQYGVSRGYIKREVFELFELLIQPQQLADHLDLATLVKFTEAIIAYAKKDGGR